MPITLIVRSEDPSAPADVAPKLTFDGHRVVIGRGSGCDVRLPDPSVTLRHASVRASLAEYTLVDEGSTNGTFVGGVRVPPHTPKPLKSGDLVRVGRVWLEVRIEQAPPTPDLAIATRDMALALVSQAMRKLGSDITTKIHVTEGRDTGLVIPLAEEGRVYVVGRSDTCDVPLLDPDVSREHAHFVRRGNTVLVRDLGSKNGVLLNGTRLTELRDLPWRSGTLRMGKTAMALEEPIAAALSELEQSADEHLDPADVPPPPTSLTGDLRFTDSMVRMQAERDGSGPPSPTTSAPIAPPSMADPATKKLPVESAWTSTDLFVMLAAVIVLAFSVAGLVWLLRG